MILCIRFVIFSLAIFTSSLCHETAQHFHQPFRRQMSPDFTPFELINVTARWTYGRTHGGHDDLAKYVTDNADQYWSTMNRAFDDYVRQRSEDIKRQWEKTVVKDDLVKGGQVSQKCFDILQYMINKPLEMEWSAKMIDSMGSLPIGLLSGTTTELGDYDQCLSVDGQFELGVGFVGKYCLATVNIPRAAYQPVTYNASLLESKWKVNAVEMWHTLDNKYSISSAVCFPSLCHQEEIRAVMRSYFEILQSLEFNVTYCQSRDDPPPYNPKLWVAITILAIPMTLVLLSAVADFFGLSPTDNKNKGTSFCFQVLHCFSPITNTQRLVRIDDTSSFSENSSENSIIEDLKSGKQKFHFVHGIRAISSVVIVLAHVSSLMIGGPATVSPFARLLPDFQANMRTLPYQVLFNGGLLVHTFFLLSGLLMSYNALSREKAKIGYLPFVLLRWLRYTPVMVGSICLTVIMEVLGSGPLAQHHHLMIGLDSCYDYWWAHLLYLQNLLPADCSCNISSWYLAAEMQIHLIAYVLLVVYAKKGSRMTFIVSSLFIGFQFLVTTAVFLTGFARPMFPHFLPFSLDILPEYMYTLRVIYQYPFNALVPYFVGAIIGQMLLEGFVLKLSPKLTKLLWTVASLVTVIFFSHTYFLMQTPVEKMFIFLPVTLVISVLLFTGALLWNLVSGWVVYQCAIDPSNAFARFLSAQIFQPFSRLSFSLCLGHFMIIGYNVLQTRTTVSLSVNGMFQQASSALVLSYLVALYLYLTWEAPFSNLVRLLWTSKLKDDKTTVKSHKEKTQ